MPSQAQTGKFVNPTTNHPDIDVQDQSSEEFKGSRIYGDRDFSAK